MIFMKNLTISTLFILLCSYLHAGKLTIMQLSPQKPNQTAESIFAESFDGSAKAALYDSQSTTQMALVNDRVVGVAVYRDLNDENESLKRYVYNFAIASAERGKGYGKEFMHLLIDDTRLHKNIHTFELDATPESKGFYSTLGLFDSTDPESLNMIKTLGSSSSSMI